MLPHLTDDDRFVTMFMDEGRLAANISSPNVVSTLDLGRADDGSLYLVMELVVGTTLSSLLRNVAKEGLQVPIDVAVDIMVQAAQGLHDAHDARTPFGAPLHIVHRDVSPQNILVGTDGRVRITDFGVARAILRRTKTSTGEFKGKLSYFSPEQCADKNLDRRSDIFSLGVVAWEAFTTRRLFHAENPLAVLERVTRMPIPLAHEVNPDVPPQISDVIAKALERDREGRFSTSAEFAHALRKAGRDAVGVTDRQKVAEIVTQFGGESLERMQADLRNSFSERPVDQAAAPDEPKTEISSGIVFRNEDGSLGPAPAVPQPPAQPHSASAGSEFHIPVSIASTIEAPKPASKLPYIVAATVAILGLGAGAMIGIMAAQNDRDQPGMQALPLDEEEAPAAAPNAAQPPAQVVETPTATAEMPTTQGAVEAAVEEPAGRGRRQRRNDRRAAPTPAPQVQPLAPSPTPVAPVIRRDPPPRATPQPQQQGGGSPLLRQLDF